MTSEVSICNRALQKLGADTIVALTDDNNRARRMALAYEPVRDAELRRRRWRFSIKRKSIPALTATPDSDYAYQYALPNDCLRVIEGGDLIASVDLSDYRGGVTALYSVEGRNILTDIGSPLAIRYIAKITDPATFDVAFAEALSMRLAMECCEAITQSDSKVAECRQAYKDALREARQANALEVAAESIADDTWVMARAS